MVREAEGKGKKGRRWEKGGKERGRDLSDECQTASYMRLHNITN